MRNFINTILSILSSLAAAPTGWAIYAGVTKQPAFPMWPPAAFVGALAVVSVDIAAALLVIDIGTFNQSLRNKAEIEQLKMRTGQAWTILRSAILAEMFLGLFIVVIDGWLPFGVVVFPLLTGAGVFAFAVRADLSERENKRDEMRVKSKRTTTTKQPSTTPTQPKRKVVTDKQLQTFWLDNPDATNAEVAQHFGRSAEAIRKRKIKLYGVKIE